MKHKKRGPANPLEPNPNEYCLAGGKKKRKYADEIEAELSSPSPELAQYVCPHCGYWHNGRSTAPATKASS